MAIGLIAPLAIVLSISLCAVGQVLVQSAKSDFSARYREAGFAFNGRADPDAYHTIYIGLPLNNIAQVQQIHDDCSNPSSPNFQRWPHESTLLSLTAPDNGLVQATRDWIQGLDPIQSEEPVSNGAVFAVTASIATLEEALQTTLYEYVHPEFGHVVRNMGSYTLPSHFQGYDVAVSGVADYPSLKSRGSFSSSFNPKLSSIRGAKSKRRSARTIPDSPTSKPTTKSTTKTTTKASTTKTTTKSTTTVKKTTTKTTTKPKTTRKTKTTTTFPDPFPTYQVYTTGSEHSTSYVSPISEPIIYLLPGYSYIENLILPPCPNGEPMSCSQGCSTPVTPVAIEAVVTPCGPVVNLEENCTAFYYLADFTVTAVSAEPGGSCFCYDGAIACPVKVDVDPNSLNQVCYASEYSDGTISNEFCTYIETGITIATPQTLHNLYNIPQGMQASAKQVQAVLEFYSKGLGINPHDLNFYLNSMGLPSVPATDIFSFTSYPPYHTDAEGSLDIQIITAIAPSAKNLYVNTAVRVPDWYVFASFVGGYGKDAIQPFGSKLARVPNVISMSWGAPETYVTYLSLSETWMMILTTRGTTVLVASGDFGYANTGTCAAPVASYPSSSAYVTSVGATALSNAGQPYCAANLGSCDDTPTEVVCSGCSDVIITSGGGYSNNIPAVSFMSALQNVYAGYVANRKFFPENLQHPPPVYQQRRGYPDISLLGANYPVAMNLSYGLGGNIYYGTSCSTPLMAGIVTLLNTILEPHNRTMGSMNRFLYTMAATFPQAFNDVVLGDNSCGVVQHSDHDSPQCSTGYYATPGWDAATGIGSPNFAILAKLVLDPTGKSLYA